MSLPAKFCRESRVIQTHRILPMHCNMHNTLYGGQLMAFVDNCASITVSRFTRSLCVTASVDSLNFIKPLNLSDSVCVETFVSGTGSTSVEVFAKIVGEKLETGERYLAATSFLTFVTVPLEGQKVYAPPVVPESDEEKYVCAGYAERQAERMQKRQENQTFNRNISIDLPWM